MTTATIGVSPSPVWNGYPSAPQVLFVNLSTTSSITLGDNPSVSSGDTAGTILPAQSSITLPGVGNWYAVTSALDGPQLQVTPGGGGWTIAPSNLFEELIASGFAAELALAIQQSGISLLSAPRLIHNNSIKSTSGTPANFGVTISDGVPAQLGLASNDYSGAINKFESFLSQGPLPSFQAKAGKIFGQAIQNSGTVTPTAKLSGMYTQGYECVYMCFTPSVVTGAPTAQNISDASGMKYVLDHLSAAHPTTELRVFIFQEYNAPSHGVSSTNFGLSLDYYYNNSPTPLRPTYKCGVCLASAWTGGTPPAIGEWSAYAFAPATAYDMIGVDFYANVYNSGGRLDSGVNKGPAGNNIVTIAHTLGVPWGVTEVGESSDGTVQSTTAYFQHISDVLVNELTNGHSLIHSMYFEGQANQPNVITSNTDPMVVAPNFYLESMIAAITTAPITGIAAGATQILSPLNPSPVAGFAISNTFSYDIQINLIASAGSTNPFATVTLQWFNEDSLTATPISVQSWELPAGTTGSAGTIITGVGPQRGQFWQIQVTNLDTVQMSVTIQTNASARNEPVDNWIWDAYSSVAIPGFNLPTGAGPNTNVVGSVAALNVAASSTVKTLMGLFAGDCWIRCHDESSGSHLQFVLSAQPLGPTLFNEVTDTSGEFTGRVVLPRAPCLLSITNNDAGGAHKGDVSIVAKN